MSTPVDLHGFGINMRLKRIKGVGQLFEREGIVSANDGWQG